MKGDFTRNTFDPDKHFLRVLMQQGRVQLDADWNEQASILLHYLQTLAEDLIGPYAGPEDHDGFKISDKDGTLMIGKGRYYVNGILCENEQEISYFDQPDCPILNKKRKNNNLDDGSYLVYLDVWERHINCIEDDDIREKALNGVDTATRSKVVWQVKVKLLENQYNYQYSYCNQGTELLSRDALVLSQLCMRARAKKEQKNDEPCLTAPEARYRGTENQLYRVEIHDGNLKENGKVDTNVNATFKFSRENGSVVFPVRDFSYSSNSKTYTVELGHLGRDDKSGLAINDWVELIDDRINLLNGTQSLLQVKKIDPVDKKVTLSGDAGVTIDRQKHALLRRWDQKNQINEHGVIEITPQNNENTTDWIELEDGIEVQFTIKGAVCHGDYWLIPARTVTGDVEWPTVTDNNGESEPEQLPPMGVVHHYAPLAIIRVTSFNVTVTSDCRCQFKPLSYSCQYSFGRVGIGTDLLCPENNK